MPRTSVGEDRGGLLPSSIKMLALKDSSTLAFIVVSQFQGPGLAYHQVAIKELIGPPPELHDRDARDATPGKRPRDFSYFRPGKPSSACIS